MNAKIDSFESSRLLLEVRREFHAKEVFEDLCEPDIYLYMSRNIPSSVEVLAKGFLELETSLSPDGKEFWLGWIAKEKSTMLPIGIFEATIIEEDVFIAYTVFKKYWGKGFAVEAVEAMMEYVKKDYPVKQFVIEMDTRNRNSTKVADKLGFNFVKVINNACFLKGFVSHEFVFHKMVS